MSDSGNAYIDVTECLGRIGGNKKLLKTLLTVFEGDASWRKLSDAVEDGNLPDAASAAHAIKGMCANLSMNKLSRKAAELEVSLKSGVFDRELFDSVSEAREKTLAETYIVKQELDS